jgi:non-specific serine/threonine protein kinase
MSAAIDWSYQLLSEPERVLFQRLSVFAGGWTLQGAESVCSGGGIEAQDVLEQLTRLLDRSLVVRMDANGAARYRLLESIREFSRQVLESGSEAEVVRERHAHHYLALAMQAEWLTRIAAEHDNLRAALRWALEQNQSILARSLAGSLWFFWANRAHLGEGRRWLEEVLARAPGGTPREVARLLHGSGALAWGQGDLDRAAKYHGQGLTLSILGDDSRGIAQALHGLALVAVQRGEYVQARSHFEQSLGLYQSIGDLDGAALERQNLGVLASKQGDNDTALHYLEASLEAARSAGNIHMAGFALSNMGGVAINRGEYGSALSLLRDALRAAQQVSAPRLVVICLEKFARVANAKGQGTRAARLVGAAESLRETHGLLESHIEHNETGQRTQVDANVHPRSRAEGQRMSMDEAVAYALSTEAADEGPLSRRELEVVRLIVGGRTNREIAEDLVIALSTAERHVANILLKLRLRSRTEIALWTVDHDVFE